MLRNCITHDYAAAFKPPLFNKLLDDRPLFYGPPYFSCFYQSVILSLYFRELNDPQTARLYQESAEQLIQNFLWTNRAFYLENAFWDDVFFESMCDYVCALRIFYGSEVALIRIQKWADNFDANGSFIYIAIRQPYWKTMVSF